MVNPMIFGHTLYEYVVGGAFLILFIAFMFVRQIVRDAIRPFWLPNANIPTPLGAGLGIIFLPVTVVVVVVMALAG
jgi:hypothetical protein